MDGKEWVNMIIRLDNLLEVLEGKKEVTGINQIENPGSEEKGGEGDGTET
jgi:hypothetical protein